MLKGSKNGKLWAVVALAAVAAGCGGKKVPIAPPPTPTSNVGGSQTGGKPTVNFTVEPSTIDRGQSALLRWSVEGANFISIDTFGAVQASGSRSITPYSTTTYHLKADGPGGSTSAEATITVNLGNPALPPETNPANSNVSNLTLSQRVSQQVLDVFFAYDQFNIEDAARTTLGRDAEAIKGILKDFPNASLIVEGHCDERGSAEYNLGLGDRRATSAKDYLVQLGVPADRVRTVSYGKERPQCTEATEDCYARNRRAHITAAQ